MVRFAKLVIALSGVLLGGEAVAGDARSAMCQDLGVVAYYSAASSLSSYEKSMAEQSERDAAHADAQRGAINPLYIDYAVSQGAIASGNGPVTRDSAVLAALGVQEECLTGKLASEAVHGAAENSDIERSNRERAQNDARLTRIYKVCEAAFAKRLLPRVVRSFPLDRDGGVKTVPDGYSLNMTAAVDRTNLRMRCDVDKAYRVQRLEPLTH